MSRIAAKLINIPSDVTVSLSSGTIDVNGKFGSLSFIKHRDVDVVIEDSVIKVKATITAKNSALSGTTRAILSNMVHGVSNKYTKTLDLVGVGYRAQLQGREIDLSLGFSHPVVFKLPEGVEAELPANNKIILSSIDKHLIGHVASKIRSIRPPEPYKGKGVKYSDEVIVRKETKKK